MMMNSSPQRHGYKVRGEAPYSARTRCQFGLPTSTGIYQLFAKHMALGINFWANTPGIRQIEVPPPPPRHRIAIIEAMPDLWSSPNAMPHPHLPSKTA